jgi:hypothetical protein
MRDLQRDWTKWTKAERVSAVLIAAILMLGVPSLLVSNINSVGSERNSSPIGRSL